MAWHNMFVSPTRDSGEKGFAFEDEVSLASVTESEWIMIPDDITRIQVTLSVAGGGKGKVQTSTDKISVVKSGSPIAVDWDYGEVAVDTQGTAPPVTAIRLAQTFAGTTKLTVRCQ